MKKLKSAYYSICLGCLLMALVSCSKEKPMTSNELINSAYTYAKAGNKWTEARDAAAKAVQLKPDDPKALLLYAIALDKTNDGDKAVSMIKKAVNLNKDNFLAQYYAGKILYDNKQNAEAIPYLKKAFALKPNDINTLILLSKACEIVGHGDALEYYRSLLKTDRFKGKSGIYNDMGVIYMKQNQKEKAAKCFIFALRKAPNDPTVNLNFAIFCDTKVNNKATAINGYKKYVELTSTAREGSPVAQKRELVKARIKKLQ